MGLTSLLEALIGLVFIYALTSLFCSAINEAIAQRVGRRGRFLREALENLIGDRWLYLHVINHPLVSSMYRDVPGKPKTPSYIAASSFVTALMDVVVQRAAHLGQSAAPGSTASSPPVETPRTLAVVREAAVQCARYGYPVADAMVPLLDAAGDSLDQARRNLENWYEHAMERVSGWYKRHTVRMLVIIGLVIAALADVDSVQIMTALSRSADLRRTLADAAETTLRTNRFNGVPLERTSDDVKIVQQDLQRFVAGMQHFEQQGLPIGFSCLSPRPQGQQSATDQGVGQVLRACWGNVTARSATAWFVKIIGWIVTGFAVGLGAPFWFDLLNKLVDLRGAGRKPPPGAVSQPQPAAAAPRP